ncbi:hypothetical protein HQ29_04200 [Porphyromonas canoris]|uniref:hypothetical protein n=1 Tax=Porphyromonas canoris TaxID=36875 RepID=UPI00051D91E3|nr:hypothetical protein [Porphyromonas canoris]KGL52842.1 hypothetical protein HQ29_04200 [Porphyromonas canoris]
MKIQKDYCQRDKVLQILLFKYEEEIARKKRLEERAEKLLSFYLYPFVGVLLSFFGYFFNEEKFLNIFANTPCFLRVLIVIFAIMGSLSFIVYSSIMLFYIFYPSKMKTCMGEKKLLSLKDKEDTYMYDQLIDSFSVAYRHNADLNDKVAKTLKWLFSFLVFLLFSLVILILLTVYNIVYYA